VLMVPLQYVLRAELGGRFGALYLAVYAVALIAVLRYAPGGLFEVVGRLGSNRRTRGRRSGRASTSDHLEVDQEGVVSRT
jgi:hypothetical protein